MRHVPVLYTTVLDLLHPSEGEVVVDVTLGLGGHAKGFLEKIGPRGKLIGIDTDEENLREAAKLLRASSPLRSAQHDTLQFIHANFRDIPHLSLPQCDILFGDLGLSSPHLDEAMRGFSFRKEGPLDCRYDRTKGPTAAELLARGTAKELLHIFNDFGEVPARPAGGQGAKKFVDALIEVREEHPIATTQDLSGIVENVYGWRAKSILSQVFQALRIAVNDELSALEVLLTQGPKLLKPGGRMGIISYHSLEDRMVKQTFAKLSEAPKHPVTSAPLTKPPFLLLTKKPIQANLTEIEDNPRARSSRFRAVKLLP